MPALSFMKRFADLVESGAKTQTIRARRKHPIKVGDRLYLYTGMRTKQCRKLGEATVSSVERFAIRPSDFGWFVLPDRSPIPIGTGHETRIARLDGFASSDAMLDWFRNTHGLPFKGVLIRWKAMEDR